MKMKKQRNCDSQKVQSLRILAEGDEKKLKFLAIISQQRGENVLSLVRVSSVTKKN